MYDHVFDDLSGEASALDIVLEGSEKKKTFLSFSYCFVLVVSIVKFEIVGCESPES